MRQAVIFNLRFTVLAVVVALALVMPMVMMPTGAAQAQEKYPWAGIEYLDAEIKVVDKAVRSAINRKITERMIKRVLQDKDSKRMIQRADNRRIVWYDGITVIVENNRNEVVSVIRMSKTTVGNRVQSREWIVRNWTW